MKIWLFISQLGYEKIVRLLITNGANVNAKDVEDKTALHAVSLEGIRRMNVFLQHSCLWNWIKKYLLLSGRENMVRILVENGANVNARNNLGNAPLNLASAGGKKHVEYHLHVVISTGKNEN